MINSEKKRSITTISCFYLILLSLLIASLFFCRKSVSVGPVSDPSDILPKKDDISGFKEKGARVIMNDKGAVAEAIDGAVEKYVNNGFVEAVQQLYSNGSIDIDIHIFNYGTNENAKAIFEDFYPSTPEVLSKGVVDVVIEHGILTTYVLNYARENIFVELIAYEKSDFSLNILKQFYLNIDGKISPSL